MAMCGPVPGEYSIHRVQIWHQLRITHSGNDPLAATEATAMVTVATATKCTTQVLFNL